MADKLVKFLAKLSPADRARILEVMRQIRLGCVADLDVKSMKGHKNLFRVRVGRFRVIYREESGRFTVIHAGKRDDQTYRDF